MAILGAAALLWACGAGLAVNDSDHQEVQTTMRATQPATVTVSLPALAFQAVDVTAEPVAVEVLALAAGGDVHVIGPGSAPFPALPIPSPAAAWAEQLTEAEMRAVLTAAGWPLDTHEAALRVAWCESRYSPGAVGGAGEMGLFQVHPRWHRDATFDPVGNARAALRISSGGYDWSAWTCRP